MTVKSRLLELLEQHKGETLSGEDIGRELSCTRAAVWKAVNSLRQEGYPIEAGPNKGYMLARESNLISAEGIRLFLEDPQVEIKIFDAISSTNLEARQLAVSGMAGHGSFVVAMEQTAGRGRRGREFYSPKGSGIYLSVILEPKGTLEGSLLITTAAATAVYKAVKEVCGVKLGIKWVNDLYKDNRKVCGILTEAVTDFESGNMLQRAKAMIPILVPLFVSAFRHANDLAMAMEARCYRGGEGRTKMKPLKYAKRDHMVYGAYLVYFVVAILLKVVL